MTEWKRVHGSQKEKPLEIDTTSSKYYVYQRRNIERVRYEDETLKTPYELWEYDERKMTFEEYKQFCAEKNRADIDFLLAMSGVNS